MDHWYHTVQPGCNCEQRHASGCCQCHIPPRICANGVEGQRCWGMRTSASAQISAEVIGFVSVRISKIFDFTPACSETLS